jgi:hypothetical protein
VIGDIELGVRHCDWIDWIAKVWILLKAKIKAALNLELDIVIVLTG